MLALWAGVLLTLAAVVACGLPHLGSGLAFDFPPRAFSFSWGFLLGLGSAMSTVMYVYFGYYGVCYIGDEVRTPARTIPRSILIAVVVVSILYLTMNLSITSVVPWREGMHSTFIVSQYMERLCGRSGRGDHHPDDLLDGLCRGVRAAAELLADTVRGGSRRVLLQRLRPAAPPRRFPPRVAAGARGGGRRGQLLRPRCGDHDPGDHPDPRAIHCPDRGWDCSASGRAVFGFRMCGIRCRA